MRYLIPWFECPFTILHIFEMRFFTTLSHQTKQGCSEEKLKFRNLAELNLGKPMRCSHQETIIERVVSNVRVVITAVLCLIRRCVLIRVSDLAS